MLVGYIAMTADGYVADADGGVGFLDPFTGEDHGFDAFWAGIDAVVMGRTTFDQVLGFGVDWPYAGREAHVITSSPLAGDAPDGVTRWMGSLAEYADAMRDRKSWVVGGARLQAAFIVEGLLDRLQVFVMPVLLGGGVPLFANSGAPIPMRLEGSKAFPDGSVMLDYRFEGR